jgi:hypothetical protein
MRTAAGLTALALLVGCGGGAPPPRAEQPTAPAVAPLALVLLVNQSGREVRLVGRSDGRVLFAEALPAQPESGGTPTGGAPSSYPTRELKVPLPPTARILEVADAESGAVARLDLTTASAAAGRGFRVVVEGRAIRISRDYYPIR